MRGRVEEGGVCDLAVLCTRVDLPCQTKSRYQRGEDLRRKRRLVGRCVTTFQEKSGMRGASKKPGHSSGTGKDEIKKQQSLHVQKQKRQNQQNYYLDSDNISCFHLLGALLLADADLLPRQNNQNQNSIHVPPPGHPTLRPSLCSSSSCPAVIPFKIPRAQQANVTADSKHTHC